MTRKSFVLVTLLMGVMCSCMCSCRNNNPTINLDELASNTLPSFIYADGSRMEAEEPSQEEPSMVKPSVDKSSTVEHSLEEPSLEGPSQEQPSMVEPSLEEPSQEEPSMVEPSLEEPSQEEPSMVEPSLEEPSQEEPSIVEPSLEEPKEYHIIAYGMCNNNCTVTTDSGEKQDLYQGQQIGILSTGGKELLITWYGSKAKVSPEFVEIYPENYEPHFEKGQWAGVITN